MRAGGVAFASGRRGPPASLTSVVRRAPPLPMQTQAYDWPPTEELQPPDIKLIISAVRQSLPQVRWTRLWVSHPGADDDGIWWFWLPDQAGEVQVESSSGTCPFDLSTDKDDRQTTAGTLESAAKTIVEWLGLPGGSLVSRWHQRREL